MTLRECAKILWEQRSLKDRITITNSGGVKLELFLGINPDIKKTIAFRILDLANFYGMSVFDPTDFEKGPFLFEGTTWEILGEERKYTPKVPVQSNLIPFRR